LRSLDVRLKADDVEPGLSWVARDHGELRVLLEARGANRDATRECVVVYWAVTPNSETRESGSNLRR